MLEPRADQLDRARRGERLAGGRNKTWGETRARRLRGSGAPSDSTSECQRSRVHASSQPDGWRRRRLCSAGYTGSGPRGDKQGGRGCGGGEADPDGEARARLAVPRVARAGVQRCVYTASEILPGKRCTSLDGSGRQSFQSKTLQPTTFGPARGARQGRQHGLHTPPAPPLPQVGLSRARGIKDAAEPSSRL